MADTTKKKADAADGKAQDGKDVPAARRGGLVRFFQEVAHESKKVTWPTFKETWWTSVMVFVMVGLTVVFFFVVDSVLAFGERLLIGAG